MWADSQLNPNFQSKVCNSADELPHQRFAFEITIWTCAYCIYLCESQVVSKHSSVPVYQTGNVLMQPVLHLRRRGRIPRRLSKTARTCAVALLRFGHMLLCCPLEQSHSRFLHPSTLVKQQKPHGSSIHQKQHWVASVIHIGTNRTATILLLKRNLLPPIPQYLTLYAQVSKPQPTCIYLC